MKREEAIEKYGISYGYKLRPITDLEAGLSLFLDESDVVYPVLIERLGSGLSKEEAFAKALEKCNFPDRLEEIQNHKRGNTISGLSRVFARIDSLIDANRSLENADAEVILCDRAIALIEEKMKNPKIVVQPLLDDIEIAEPCSVGMEIYFIDPVEGKDGEYQVVKDTIVRIDAEYQEDGSITPFYCLESNPEKGVRHSQIHSELERDTDCTLSMHLAEVRKGELMEWAAATRRRKEAYAAAVAATMPQTTSESGPTFEV